MTVLVATASWKRWRASSAAIMIPLVMSWTKYGATAEIAEVIGGDGSSDVR